MPTEYRTLMSLDVEKSAGRGDRASENVMRVLQTEVYESLGRNGVARDDCQVRDTGDGMVLAAPRSATKSALLHAVVHDLAPRLRWHNNEAGPDSRERIRLRVALHAGEIGVGPDWGRGARPLEVLARLLEAPQLRAALSDAPSDTPLAVLLSGNYYDDAVPHRRTTVLPEDFVPVEVRVKEYQGSAYLLVPHSVPRGAPRADAEPERAAAPENDAAAKDPSQGGIHVDGHGTVGKAVIVGIVHGDINI